MKMNIWLKPFFATITITLGAGSALAQAGGGNTSIGTGTPAGHMVTLDESDANNLFHILKRIRLPNPEPRSVGAQNIFAAEVYCTRGVYPNATGSCRVTGVDASGTQHVRDVINQDGDDLYELLMKYAGPIKTQHMIVGATNTRAANLSCSRPIVPDPVVSCTLYRE